MNRLPRSTAPRLLSGSLRPAMVVAAGLVTLMIWTFMGMPRPAEAAEATASPDSLSANDESTRSQAGSAPTTPTTTDPWGAVGIPGLGEDPLQSPVTDRSDAPNAPEQATPTPTSAPGAGFGFGGLITTPDAARADDESAASVVSAALHRRDVIVPAGGRSVLAVVLNVAPPYHINPDDAQIPAALDFLIPTSVVPGVSMGDAAAIELGAVHFPQAKRFTVQYTGAPIELPAFQGPTVFYVPIRVSEQAAPGEVAITLSVTWQACDDRVCLPPETIELATSVMVASGDAESEVDPQAAGLFDDYVAPQTWTPVTDDVAGMDSGVIRFDLFGISFAMAPGGALGLATLLLIAAVGGFLLNLTPCVLPVIPIKMMSLSAAAGNRAKCLALGVLMTLGVITFWLGLGLAMTLVTGFTAMNQLFQYPLFTITVGVVIATMAVGMCGLFTIQLPQAVYRWSPRHDTLTGSFGFGVMTAVLSTPCTAPFMGAAAAWSVTQPAIVTLATFIAIGAGMAAPYLVLSAFPHLVQRMPRTGPASELIKQIMGLLMLAAASYFVGAGVSGLAVDPPSPPSTAYWWAVAGFIVAAGAWLIWRTVRITPAWGRRVGFGVVGGFMIIGAVSLALRLTDKGPIDWIYYTPDRFQAALDQGHVVVLEFTAEWCLNCKAMEATVLQSSRVTEAFARAGVTPIKIDLTGANPEGKAKLKSVGRVAIPLLMVFGPDGSVLLESDAYTIDQVVGAIEQGLSNRVAVTNRAAIR